MVLTRIRRAISATLAALVLVVTLGRVRLDPRGALVAEGAWGGAVAECSDASAGSPLDPGAR